MYDEFLGDTLRTTLVLEPDLPLTLALFASEPNRRGDKAVTYEVRGDGYGRQTVRFDLDDEFARNREDVFFERAKESWGMLTHLGVFDPDGRMLLYKGIGSVMAVGKGERVRFGKGDLAIFLGRNHVVRK